jgi:hypothetical protein
MPNKIQLRPLLLILLVLFMANGGVAPLPPGPPLHNGKEIYNYRATQAVFGANHLPLNQKNIGTCVAVAGKGVIDGENAMAYLAGKRPKPLPVSAESLYGGRVEVAGRNQSRYGDGWYGAGLAKWVTEVGGQIYEKNYPDHGIDLSDGYSVERARDYGQYGNGGSKDGINGPFDVEARKNKFDKRARISSLEELDAALENYHFVETCSGLGFDSPRDKDGFCRQRGGWSHAQFFCGRRTKEVSGRDGYLVQNSWGSYIAGDGPNSKNKYLDQPDGSYWVSPADAMAMLRAGDSWVVTYGEFKAERDMPWLHVAHAQVPAELLNPEPEAAPEPPPPPPPPAAPPEVKTSDSLLSIPAVAAMLKPVMIEGYTPIPGLLMPSEMEPVPVAVVPTQPAVRASSACASGSCYFPRRRWFR